MSKYFLFLGLAICLHSCTEENDIEPELTQQAFEYYLTDLGSWKEYQVNEISYLQKGLIRDTQNYYLREEITEKHKNEIGDSLVLFNTFIRNSPSSNWKYIKSSILTLSDKEIVLTDDNLKFIKFIRPPKLKESWLANSYFDDKIQLIIGGEQIAYFKNWSSSYENLNATKTINGHVYSNCIEILLADYENRLEKRYVTEVYTKGLGLIYKKLMILDTQCFEGCENTSWEQKAAKGHILTQQLIDYN